MSYRILVVEKDIMLAQKVKNSLLTDRTSVNVAYTLKHAYQKVEEIRYDLVIVDQVLADGDGLELAERLNSVWFNTRIICVSALKEAQNRIDGLQRGADDYVCKPYALAELVLRVNKLLHKEKKLPLNYLRVGNVMIFPDSGVLSYDGIEIVMRKKETEILSCLFRQKNRVVTRETLVRMVWGQEDICPSHITLDVYIRRLRILLAEHSPMIKTIRGFGYSVVEKSRP